MEKKEKEIAEAVPSIPLALPAPEEPIGGCSSVCECSLPSKSYSQQQPGRAQKMGANKSMGKGNTSKSCGSKDFIFLKIVSRTLAAD